jgi:hypothetical protein
MADSELVVVAVNGELLALAAAPGAPVVAVLDTTDRGWSVVSASSLAARPGWSPRPPGTVQVPGYVDRAGVARQLDSHAAARRARSTWSRLGLPGGP